MNEEIVRDKSPSQMKLKLTFSILIISALFIIELYFMMNFPESYLVIGIIGLAILCFVYLITDLTFKMQNEKELLREKEYESIYKGEKVNYILMKQGFADLEEMVKGNRSVVDFPVDELVHAQKAVGKVTIQRGKENTSAILNANEKLMDRLLAFEDKLDEINNFISSSQENNPQEIVSALQGTFTETKDSIQDTVYELSESTRNQINAVTSALDEMKQRIESVDEKAAAIDEIRKFTEVVDKKASAFDEMKKLIASVEQKSSELSMGDVRTAPVYRETVQEPMSMPKLMIEEPVIPDAPVLPEEPMEIPTPAAEEMVLPEEPVEIPMPAAEEMVLPEEPMEIPMPAAEEMVLPEEPMEIPTPIKEEPVKAPEPIMEEPVAPLPNMSDPGHMMTPEEIASLLANM